MHPMAQSDEIKPIDQLTTQAGYDRWAHIYDSEDNPLVGVEESRVVELLGQVRGLCVADVGCGTGRHAFRLAGEGADVTALDFSEGMLAKARAKAGSDRIHWRQHDLADPLPVADGSLDRILCGLVVDHIAELTALFADFHRALKPDGFAVISVMHPAMMLKGVQARFTDPATGRETRPASIPNQISDYVMAALNAGLRIDHISEHVVDDAYADRSPRAAKYRGWPILLLMKLSPTPTPLANPRPRGPVGRTPRC